MEMPEIEARRLLESRKTVVMATADKDAMPHVSYAPFVHIAPHFYVYTSSLSQHTKNMLENANVSVMFVEDEADASNIFARKRFTVVCGIGIVARESDEWNDVLSRFESTFGEIFSMIRPLGDFTLFRLLPGLGLFVRGFGQAFEIGPAMSSAKHVRKA